MSMGITNTVETLLPFLKAHSHKLRLMHLAAANGCISAYLDGDFLFFRTAYFCRSRMCKMQLVWICLYWCTTNYRGHTFMCELRCWLSLPPPTYYKFTEHPNWRIETIPNLCGTSVKARMLQQYRHRALCRYLPCSLVSFKQECVGVSLLNCYCSKNYT